MNIKWQPINPDNLVVDGDYYVGVFRFGNTVVFGKKRVDRVDFSQPPVHVSSHNIGVKHETVNNHY